MDTPPPPLPSPPLSSHKDDRLWCALCHVSLLLGVGFVLPLVVYLVKRNDDPVVAGQAREALNFHISVYLYGVVSVLLCMVLIGFVMLVVLTVGAIVLSLVATIKASEGGFYRYPLTLRLV